MMEWLFLLPVVFAIFAVFLFRSTSHAQDAFWHTVWLCNKCDRKVGNGFPLIDCCPGCGNSGYIARAWAEQKVRRWQNGKWEYKN